MADVIDSSWGWRVQSDDDDDGGGSRVTLQGSCSQQQVLGGVTDGATTGDDDGWDKHEEDEPLLPADQAVPVKRGYRPTMAEIASSTTQLHQEDTSPSHVTQYVTALSATMGALAMGTILGYSSPAGPQLVGSNASDSLNCSLIQDEPLTESELSLFSSLVNIGALVGAPLGGILINWVGRRGTMLTSIVPFVVGWVLIGFAANFAMLAAGRVVLGLCCGLVSLSVPTYLGEISSPDIRGLLGTGFQVMVVIGILYVYGIGAATCWQWLALACLVPALAFVILMFFSKESPTFLLAKNKSDDARKSLEHFRGKHYDVDLELERLKESVEVAQANKASVSDLKKKHVMRPLVISLALMVFQQFSGINAILFNLNAIFDKANLDLSSSTSSIVIAAVQVAATLVGAMLMDRAGRRLLLLLSSAAMAVSLVTMGVYFYLEEQETNTDSLWWLPLVSLIVYIAFFSVGFGPIPWLMMGELFSADVRELASTLSTLTNWTMAFAVTFIFAPLQAAIHDSGVYWLFAAVMVVSFFFSLFVVKETKGKTIEEITAMFGGPAPSGQRPSVNAVVGHENNAFEEALEGHTNHV